MKKSLMPVLVLIIGCFFAIHTFAQETPRVQVEKFLKELKPGRFDLAVDAFAKGSLIKAEFVDQIKSQTRTLLPTERTILGYEFLGEQNIGTSLKRLHYLLKTGDQALSWSFTFYKPAEVWLPSRVIVGDDLLL